ncbi:hypothetical protein [Aurantiacibacter aquimixticola]|uniref:Uncharacterized protein n=1 Tax=Aurantiacibacter aquimixticola TaxID=1958945 RepID=A0A419RR45_9SPHN|nr:hypothetical protein [Aurantiacibacter aquimixticola]RJY08258.1 hypothetical protein D6201_01790 [Aurantiacibacter aquimixticola]
MKKPEAEQGIRYLCTKWAREIGLNAKQYETASFSQFWTWLRLNHPEYLDFGTSTSVAYDVEMWFEQEMNQSSYQ